MNMFGKGTGQVVPGGAVGFFPGQAPGIYQRIQPETIHQRNIAGRDQPCVGMLVARLVQCALEQGGDAGLRG